MAKNLYKVDGQYGVRFYYKSSDGKRKLFRHVTGARRLREAEAIRDKWMTEAKLTGRVAEFEREKPDAEPEEPVYTFSGYAWKWWEDHVKVENRPSQVVAKESSIRFHLIPFFGDIDIGEIDAHMVVRLKSALLEKGLSKTSVNRHVGHVRAMLNKAVEWEYLEKAPKIKDFKIERQDRDFYTVEERDHFLEVCNDKRPGWHPYFVVAFHCGLRAGELAALRWDDVDFNGRFIRVQRTRWRGHEHAPKGHRSRNVPMNSLVWDVLTTHEVVVDPFLLIPVSTLVFLATFFPFPNSPILTFQLDSV